MREAENEGGADAAALRGRRILLVIAGGIAAYKCLDLIRRLRENGAEVRCILTRAGAAFVTPLSVETLAGQTVYTDTLALTGDSEIAHIRLGQEADIVVVAPATADIMAKMAHGIADDLATSTLIATDKPVLVAPAMNTRMWRHPATANATARGWRRTASPWSVPTTARWRRARAAPDAWRRCRRSWPPSSRFWAPAPVR